MASISSRFRFASAPDSWGVLDNPGPSWNQPYETMLDEMVGAGYAGTDLGPYGFFPTDPGILGPQLTKRNLKLLGSFVPVVLGDPASATVAVERIKRVGGLLSALSAPFLVMADVQSSVRDHICGRVPSDGSASLNARQWKDVSTVVLESMRVANDHGLDLIFHPHVATYIETPAEVERFFDVTAGSGIGLCLDTGHCVYGGGDPVIEAEKYRRILRLVHIKDVDRNVLTEARRKGLSFEGAIERNVFTIVGQGSIDFQAFFRSLANSGYSGWMVVEQDVTFGKTEVPPAQSIAASLQYLRNVVEQITGVATSQQM
jgi:inosose dehydratase